MNILFDCSLSGKDDSECHSTLYTHGKCALKSISEFTTEEIDLFILRYGIRLKSLKTVCLHHQKMYLDHYTKLNPYCCDPIGRHVENKYIKGRVFVK